VPPRPFPVRSEVSQRLAFNRRRSNRRSSTPTTAGAAAGIAALLGDPLNSVGVFSDGSDGEASVRCVPRRWKGHFARRCSAAVNMRPTFMHTGQIWLAG